ncbi:spore germination protein [Paenibacillus sp. CGMCC 1.16610]|uniref:Spore germination protein n=1 Tax=Paenibacillus anseongense TaxID=2682845 RepID=A0ABW9UGZ6_9BACL|nr:MULTISPECIES: spore germination protein [Paenibacillus]MBA2939792.1 spore germination protein [Paenibacillus sp. CGMCC 1.16610]MVQ39452.1 spore germination protein [Paenibacillus anseongense]
MIEQILAELNNPSDLFYDTLDNGYIQMELVYFPELCDQTLIKDGLIIPYSYCFQPEEFERMINTNPNYGIANQTEYWTQLLLNGTLLFKIEDTVFRFYVQRKFQDKPDTVQIEASLQGPQTALTEDLDLNISLIRMRYNVPSLSVEQHIIGDHSKTRISVLYDKNLINNEVLDLLNERINSVQIRTLRAAGQLLQALSGKRHRLFPIILQTERPDRIAIMIERGKVALLQDGSRFGLLLPVRLIDFLHAMDDDYESYWMSKFLLILRYFAMLLTITLPALYIAIVSYNPEILRVQLTLSIAGSRVVVPYPSFIEVFIMLFMIEALNEASLRLPRYIGSTATTVGGLILGQAIQQAGLVSSIMIIVTSVVAISNFVIPNNGFGYSVRFIKYIFVIVSIFYGLLGVVVSFFALIVYWCNLRSFGLPYFAYYIPKLEAKAHHYRKESN